LRQQTSLHCLSNEAAIQHTCQMMGSANFHDPFILECIDCNRPEEIETGPIWTKEELRHECQRRKNASAGKHLMTAE
ncbi:MAG TPA: hypothetical protein VJ723_08710, partial [Candidatus Angelobacter sp.]|nr:hypothetical protein [Candidatus Angelobacter sp.]